MSQKKEYVFKESTIKENKHLLKEYIRSITGAVDDFWEEHVSKADFHLIFDQTAGEEAIGFFTLFSEWDEKTYITSFYVRDSYIGDAQRIFKKILGRYQIRKGYILTCDELFLSVGLDYQSKVEMQAYMFDGTKIHQVRPAEFGRDKMQKVSLEELPKIRELTGDFYDDCSDQDIKKGKYELYKMVDEGEILGVGIIAPNRLKKGYAACGEIVLEQHRRKGVARSLQLNMAEICRERGWIPVGGCWYGNTNSRKTFDSSGRYSKTRILNVTFISE